MKQQFTSAATDRKQIPAIFKILLDNWDSPVFHGFTLTNEILDYGGGASDKLTDEFAKFGIRNLVLDPFNRTEEHNALVRRLLTVKPADHAICSNMLNVIREPKIRLAALEEIAALTSPEGSVFITVHEGDRSSRGRRTGPDQWQTNRPLKSYIPELRKVFAETSFFGGSRAIVCTGRRERRRGRKVA